MCGENCQIICCGSKTAPNDGGGMQVLYLGWAKVPVSM